MEAVFLDQKFCFCGFFLSLVLSSLATAMPLSSPLVLFRPIIVIFINYSGLIMGFHCFFRRYLWAAMISLYLFRTISMRFAEISLTDDT